MRCAAFTLVSLAQLPDATLTLTPTLTLTLNLTLTLTLTLTRTLVLTLTRFPPTCLGRGASWALSSTIG